MPRKLDIQALLGSRSGRLTLIREGEPIFSKTSNTRAVICKCDCGTMVHIHLISFTRGNSKSCGCARIDMLRERNTTHGKLKTRAYRIWVGMLRRARGKADRKLYFDRGIGVCERWKSFENFYTDMGECPKGLSIDRIDNDKGYSPENCRWATAIEQAANKRNTVWVDFKGERLLLAEVAKIVGITPNRLFQRLREGMKDPFAPLNERCRTHRSAAMAAAKDRVKGMPELDDPIFE